MTLAGASITTGWGRGLSGLPTDAHVAAGDRHIVPLPTPQTDDERRRRATRECILATTAVEEALAASALSTADLAGPRTAVLYASASSYAAANWEFLNAATRNVMKFPYTAPCAVPGEVSMRFRITGPAVAFLSGASAGLEALWYAKTLLLADQCDRALVLGVETFAECEDLYTATRRLLHLPLVEATFCLIIDRRCCPIEMRYTAVPDDLVDPVAGLAAALSLAENSQAAVRDALTGATVTLAAPTLQSGEKHVRTFQDMFRDIPISFINTRVGNCLSAGPIIGLLLALDGTAQGPIVCLSSWADTLSMLIWPSSSEQPHSSQQQGH